MPLLDRINQDLKTALKTGDKPKLNVLRLLKSQLKYKEIELGEKLSEQDVIQTLNTAVKKRQESMDLYEKAGRTDLFEKESNEVAIIKEYLPEPLSSAELAEAISQIINKLNASSTKDMGLVMKSVMDEYRGRVDGKEVQKLVREQLS